MAHLSGIQAGFFSNLAFNTTAVMPAMIPDSEGAWEMAFATAANIQSIPNVREFPGIGTPANIVNVPTYGSSTSRQIQGQSDAPNLELTINYDPSALAGIQLLEGAANSRINDGNIYQFQFSLLGQQPVGSGEARFVTGASTTAGLGSVPNSNFYFAGRFEAIAVNPQLTDANQATLTLSLQSSFFGPFTSGTV